jgi:hypothetical protein
MIPQDNFIIIAKVDPTQLAPLRALLATMNLAGVPGMADPANALVAFGGFEAIHYARFVVLADNTLSDRAYYPQLPREEPTYLCLMVDCDGDAGALLKRMARECAGLKQIFAHCGFDPSRDLEAWVASHRVRAAASYVNWVGRSAVEARQEARLHDLLREALSRSKAREPQALLAELRGAVGDAAQLTSRSPTPLGWRIANLLGLLTPLIVAAACFLFIPWITIAAILVALAIFFIALRRRETDDPIIANVYDPAWVAVLTKREDHDVTNQYTAMGSIKPGLFRLGLELVVLSAVNWAARHIYTRGALGRIGTIHFAHWVFLDERRRGFFCSNYDGGHEAYMDDFINKAAFGLNLSFSSFISYPQTDWLIGKGAWREQEFKLFQRRHQIPTDVWYKAYPGLTARDLARNARIRNGFEKSAMSDDEIRRWLAEI